VSPPLNKGGLQGVSNDGPRLPMRLPKAKAPSPAAKCHRPSRVYAPISEVAKWRVRRFDDPTTSRGRRLLQCETPSGDFSGLRESFPNGVSRRR
jgi:hypothetical protein